MALKGIEKVEQRFCVETAVYWGNPQDNGYGGFTWDAPIELIPPNGVRWENVREIMLDQAGREFTCNSSVLLTQDVDLEGYMFRGTLADLALLPDVDINNPISIAEAYMIRRFDRIPMVRKNDEFVRTAYLFYYGK